MSDTNDTASGGTERQKLVEIVALLDEIDHKFNRLGGQQSMSVGPVLTDVQELRESVVERGKGYGILDESETVTELRVDANDLDVVVQSTTETERIGGDDE